MKEITKHCKIFEHITNLLSSNEENYYVEDLSENH
jgi:hypothetical protein